MNDFKIEEETTPRGEYKAVNGIFEFIKKNPAIYSSVIPIITKNLP